MADHYKKRVGDLHEEKAAKYLETKGYAILEKNYRCRMGEADIIAKKDGVYVFVEVKYRKYASSGYPLEAVNLRKQKKISRCVDHYRMIHSMGDGIPFRFDVVGILGDEITHIENAFEYVF